MRRAIILSILVLVIVVGGAVGYALVNLNSIIQANRGLILRRVSRALGRPVTVSSISARLGWGVFVEVDDLAVADDPAFAQRAFFKAAQIALDLEFFPLLRGKAKLEQLRIIKPRIRIVRNRAGILNISTIGENSAAASQQAPSHASSSLAMLAVKSLIVEGATVVYQDLATAPVIKPVKLHLIDLYVTDLGVRHPFNVNLRMTALGHEQNLAINGKIGPLVPGIKLAFADVPIDLNLRAQGISIDKLRALAVVGEHIPPQLSVSAPVSLTARASGTLARLSMAGALDLTAQAVSYGTWLRKPAGVGFSLDTSGTRSDGKITLSRLAMRIGPLEATASHISFAVGAPLSATIETNRVNLAELAPLFPFAAKYQLSGTGQVNAAIVISNGKPDGSGLVSLQNAGIRALTNGLPAVTGLTGTARFDHGRIVIEPTAFMIDSSRASINATLDSIRPLSAGYTVSIDSIHPARFLKNRNPGEVLDNVVVTGTARGDLTAPVINARVLSSDGLFASVRYRNLDATTTYADHRISLRPLLVGVFEGTVAANANATLGERARFGLGLNLAHVNVEQALRSQNISAASWVHGFLSGNLTATGNGRNWREIEPTLSGSGGISMTNGQLVGVNIVALAINGITSVPGVSQIINAAFRSSHQGLLADPNTELDHASMTFVLSGPRIMTHDLSVQSSDYGITGDGWFDLNKRIDMDSDIRLTFGLSFAIPVWVKGTLPTVLVLPNVPKLTERLAMGAIRTPGRILQGGLNAVGSALGGGSSSSGSGSSGSSLPNPLKTLKNLMP
jgi:uncharacterized protein involved in outer membrane biogenesis